MIMRPATLFFHDGLADLLDRRHCHRDAPGLVLYPVTRRASIKDIIEALGPPHTEVGDIKADGLPVGFGHLLQPGQELHVRPVYPPLDVLRPSPLRPSPLPRLAFLADANVGRLATLLRALGFDTAYDRNLDDAQVAGLAETQGRVVLTRDRSLLKRRAIDYGYLIRPDDPQDQLLAVLRFFGLRPPFPAFTRCPCCNARLDPVPKADIIDRLLPLTRLHYAEFRLCPQCDKIYWPGSHRDHMQARIEDLARRLDGQE